jgi:valyl-tRNA synthetase
MPLELPKAYDPQAAQAKWFSFWESRGWFDANPNPAKKPHVIMIPLPNVTGALHMGHALNGTLQDLLTRWKRMQGYEALWMPGTDHAGIATQAVVEKRMFEEEGKTRHDVGRDELVKRIWKWKEEYEARILGQLKQLGASCDWRRVRFTLDDVCSKAVRRTFFKMFKDGLIYRGQRLVNWDVHLQTAVADDEVYTEEVPGKFWTFNYPVVDDNGRPTGEKISFSTTRPETMLGDTAVCVHPTDERYTHLVGKNVRIPLNGRLIPIIADALLADKDLGTGCVKVTPAHDPNDYACGQRNKLPLINILNPDGTLNENAGEWKGQDRAKARDEIVARMESLGYFEKVEDRQIPMKFSDRSKTPIEPYLSDQWFVKMSDHADGRPGLAQMAMDAVTDGRVKFFPERYQSAYLDWLAEKRDWCISRQLWWGHRIPVWKLPNRLLEVQQLARLYELKEKRPNDIWIQITESVSEPDAAGEALTQVKSFRPNICLNDTGDDLRPEIESWGYEQDPDVLDTWFSSALWPHATLGWPDLDHDPPMVDDAEETRRAGAPLDSRNHVLEYFYPGSVLVTSRDIITLWVARMVLTGLYNMGDVPFRHVHVHPKILDGFGQTMSKTKGNGVDPLELIERYGCDGMRFTIASFAGETQDVRLPVGYECPHCQNVIPQTQQHLKFKPGKPKIKCPKCKQESQYACPHYVPDPGEPVARIVIERFEYGRNFCNKLWNAARFAMLNLEGYAPGEVTEEQLALEDRWILSRLATVTEEVTDLLGRYQFDAATRSLREFVWNEFCDWYLELIKPRLRDDALKSTCQRVLVMVLDTILRLLHPFTPFITEELWQRLNEIAPNRLGGGRKAPESPLNPEANVPRSKTPHLSSLNSQPSPLAPQPAAEACIIAPWPAGLDGFKQLALERRFARLQETIVAVRNLRGVYNISAQATVDVFLRCDGETAGDLEAVKEQFESLARGKIVAIGPDVVRPKAAASFSLGSADGYIPLAGLIDLAAEKARQQKEAEKLRGFIAGSEKKLSNTSFTDRAPPEVVQEVRDTLANQRRQLASVEEILRELEDV